MKLFDSEWKVMEVLWQQNDQTAKAVSLHLAQSAGCRQLLPHRVFPFLRHKTTLSCQRHLYILFHISTQNLELYLTNFFDGTTLKNEKIDYI